MIFRPPACAGHALIAALCLAVPPLAAQEEADPPPALDPQAIEILGSAADFLAGQEAMQFDWFVSFDEVIDGREKLTSIRSGQNLLQRETGFFGMSEQGMETREYYFDGVSFAIHDVEEDAYVLAPFTGSFEALVDRLRTEYDVVLPIWTVMARTTRSQLVEDAERAAYLGMTRINGRAAHHIALSNYDEDWQVWVADDPDRPVPLMIVGTNPYEQGWPQYRAYFANWDFAPEIAEDRFTFVPGDDSERMAWPKTARAGN